MIKTIVQALELKGEDNLLDLGCGGGWITQELGRHCNKITGVDISIEMLQNALKELDQDGIFCAEAAKLPFKEEAFSKVLCYFVFINIMDMDYVKESIKEIYRVLKKGGIAFIGQLPDSLGSGEYDKEKESYIEYCSKEFNLGKNNRNVHTIPINLYDKPSLKRFLEEENITHEICNSFNPFYRPGQEELISWRFDLILKKK